MTTVVLFDLLVANGHLFEFTTGAQSDREGQNSEKNHQN